jgi:hypothetical protein
MRPFILDEARAISAMPRELLSVWYVILPWQGMAAWQGG